MSTGGLSLTIGKQQQSGDVQSSQTTAAASTVGAIAGNVNLSAGQTFTLRGSDVLAAGQGSGGQAVGGAVNISAQSVTIEEARETAASRAEQRLSQSGVSVGISAPIISTAQSLATVAQATGNTQSSRMQALGAATVAVQAREVVQQAGKIGQALGQGGQLSQAANISLTISAGSSQSQSSQSSSSDTARGSSVTAAGNVTIIASGAGHSSDITVRGSDIQAGGAARLSAEDQVKLVAAQNTQREASSQSSRSGSMGVSVGATGLSATASASRGQGQGAGEGTGQTNTQVSGQSVQISSGGDTTLRGAVVQGERVAANVGGNLTIDSLQDRSQYRETSQQIGGSVAVGSAPGGSLSAGRTAITSNYQSVGEQSALRAGDGGFQVNVQGNTTLTGGAITSSQGAVDSHKNTFTTAGQTAAQAQQSGALALNDVNNSARFEARGASVGVNIGTQPGKESASLSGVGVGSTAGQASSTTVAAISGLAGNVAARTGDAQTGIKPIFEVEKVKKEIEAQVTITQEFNKQAGKAIESYVTSQRKALHEQAQKASTAQEKAQAEQAIRDVNMQERALNILVSAFTGMTGSVITKEALSTAAEKMRDLMIEDSKSFAGVVDKDGKPLFSNVSGGSAGVNNDGLKIAGTRADLYALCGADGGRCRFATLPDGSIDKSKPVEFLGKESPDGSRQTYAEFLKTPEGQKMTSAPFGGLQGGERTWLFGMPYEKGGWVDKLLESFAGPHDLIGGKLSGLYDQQGNATRGRSEVTKGLHEIASGVAIPLAAPFAASQFFSPEAWKAIGIFLKGGL
jgi:filamentous hemagglutinin